jgi:hypothetical protein
MGLKGYRLWAMGQLDSTCRAPPRGLEVVDVRVHAPRGGGAEGAGRHAVGGLGGPGVVHRVVLHVLRHALAVGLALFTLLLCVKTPTDDSQ